MNHMQMYAAQCSSGAQSPGFRALIAVISATSQESDGYRFILISSNERGHRHCHGSGPMQRSHAN